MSDLQLQMNFAERRNRFRDALGRGEFVLLIENTSPGRDNDPAAIAERLAALESAVLAVPGINAALAITDGTATSTTGGRRNMPPGLSPGEPRPPRDLISPDGKPVRKRRAIWPESRRGRAASTWCR